MQFGLASSMTQPPSAGRGVGAGQWRQSSNAPGSLQPGRSSTRLARESPRSQKADVPP